jgi:hypothetical protein
MQTNTYHTLTGLWKKSALALAVGGAILFGAGTATGHAALITPTAVTAQSFYAGDGRSPVRAIDGSGMSPNAPVLDTSTCGNGPGNNMWLSNGNRDTWITFDLGSSKTISGFHLWNYNEINGTFVGRGVKTAGIYAGNSLLANGTAYASAGAAWGSLVQNFTFSVATGLTSYTGADYNFTAPVTTRYIQIYVTDNFRTNDAYTGISEIRFIEAPAIAATILDFGTNVAGSTASISPVVSNAGTIAWTVPYGTVLAPLAPTFTLFSAAATCNRTSGAVPSPNFGAGPVTYTVTDGATVNTYTVTATAAPPSTARDILTFNNNSAGSNAIITSTGASTGTIEIVVPFGTPSILVGAIAPTFTLSAGATCSQLNNSRPTPNLSIGGTVHYIVTAQDGVSTKDYAVTVRQSAWRYSPWTNDADSGITGVQADYTVAVNTGTAGDAAVTVNGINFEANAVSGTNYAIGGAIAATGRGTNVTGSGATLANNFTYNASPRTVTLTNLTPSETYETSFFAYAWDASGRVQTFSSGGDNYIADQDAFGFNNGIRISYTFVATATSQVLTITAMPGGQGTFHMSALANRRVIVSGDTDNDGLADTWEMEKAGNLTDLTATGDFDNDGLSDADEYVLRSLYPALNPKLADTDSDGLSDRAEILPTAPRAATNPTAADSDGDGLNDFVENNSGTYGGAANPGTNPNSNDSDGDQYPDVYEIAQGGNPVLNTSYPSILPAGIALGVVTDEASTGIKLSDLATYTHKISGGGAATVNSVVLDILDTTTTPPNFTWNPNAGGKNHIPPINNGGWVPATGNVTGPGNFQMFGGFTYSGGGGAPGSSQQYILSALEVGRTYEMRVFIRKWDDGTVRPHILKFTNGAQVTNFQVLEDRPGIVLGNGNNESAYYISYTYVAQSTTLTMEATIPNVSSGNGSFHLYGLTNRVTSPPPPLEFNSVVRSPNVLPATGFRTTLDIKTRPGRTYGVYFSTDLVTWLELTDSLSAAATGTSTIYVDEAVSDQQRTFYRVDDLTP